MNPKRIMFAFTGAAILAALIVTFGAHKSHAANIKYGTLVRLAAANVSASQNFSPINVCASCLTQPFGINESGLITGTYVDADGAPHGFLLRGGNYVNIDVPDSLFVEAAKSNDAGAIAGDYVAQDGIDRPFVRDRFGNLIFKSGFPGAAVTYGVKVNNQGSLLGGYTLDPSGATGFHGYILTGIDFATFDYPGANVTSTFPLDMNEVGTIVGSYKTTTEGEEHGFMRSAQGVFTQIDFPGSVQSEAFGINAAGDIVGRYLGTDGHHHGFLLRNGNFTSIDYLSPNTYAWGINSRGTIVGYSFADSPSGPINGFKLGS